MAADVTSPAGWAEMPAGGVMPGLKPREVHPCALWCCRVGVVESQMEWHRRASGASERGERVWNRGRAVYGWGRLGDGGWEREGEWTHEIPR
jgi:hypothetical protein